jgi:hypothetical protein
MNKRGEQKRKRCVVPDEVPVWVRTGRWGARRVRVEQCVTLRAELVYHQMICEGLKFHPGFRAELEWTAPGSDTSWSISLEVVANAVWRRGRMFFRCRGCCQRATRLYVPVANLEPRCRRCWGLNYASQSWSYKASGPFAFLGPIAYVTTHERRRIRRDSSRERLAIRRQLADKLSG